ncbi:14238_t:CDS:2, partial [Dentiscutata erythropus]
MKCERIKLAIFELTWYKLMKYLGKNQNREFDQRDTYDKEFLLTFDESSKHYGKRLCIHYKEDGTPYTEMEMFPNGKYSNRVLDSLCECKG